MCLLASLRRTRMWRCAFGTVDWVPRVLTSWLVPSLHPLVAFTFVVTCVVLPVLSSLPSWARGRPQAPARVCPHSFFPHCPPSPFSCTAGACPRVSPLFFPPLPSVNFLLHLCLAAAHTSGPSIGHDGVRPGDGDNQQVLAQAQVPDGSDHDGGDSNGTYNDGAYDADVHHDGIYLDGTYHVGSHHDGTDCDTTYDEGTDRYGTYDDGTNEDGIYHYGIYHNIHRDGIDHDGIHYDDTPRDSMHHDGRHHDGERQLFGGVVRVGGSHVAWRSSGAARGGRENVLGGHSPTCPWAARGGLPPREGF